LSNAGILAEYIGPIRDGMITAGAPTAALHRDLVVDPRDIYLEKPRFGAFHGTDLELVLRTRGVDSVIIGGIATNVCCEATAREASARDFRLFFLSDGTATSGIGALPPEHFQTATCATMQLFGQVLTIDEMAAKLGAA
jgi:ureidoacrylate peracid hydrolase